MGSNPAAFGKQISFTGLANTGNYLRTVVRTALNKNNFIPFLSQYMGATRLTQFVYLNKRNLLSCCRINLPSHPQNPPPPRPTLPVYPSGCSAGAQNASFSILNFLTILRFPIAIIHALDFGISSTDQFVGGIKEQTITDKR